MKYPNIKFLFSIILISGLYKVSFAQDIHFSQFYNSPLSLNPAMTGLMKEDIRGSVIYRNQWKSANAMFRTVAFAGDMNFPFKHTKPDRLGAGLFVFNDNMGDGIITNNSAYFSVAYHKVIGSSKRLKLSGGLQPGYVQKTLDYTTLYYSSQVNNYQFDPTLPSGEPLGKVSSSYFNLNAGAGASYKLNDKTDLFTGISFFNINNPGEKFRQSITQSDLNKLKGRYTVTGLASYKLSDRMVLLPAVLFMKQARVLDFNVGTSVGYLLKDKAKTMVQAGLWYRSADALIFMAGIKYNHINLGLSYDFTTSSFKDVKNAPTVKDNAVIGAFEVTLIYVGFLNRPLPGELTIPCRFF